MKTRFLPQVSVTLICILLAMFMAQPVFGQSTWTGTISTDWNTPDNWSPVAVPAITNDVIIPSGPANQPVISAGTLALARSVTVNSGASLSISSTASLSVSTGGVLNSGTVVNSGSLVVSSGTSAGLTNDGSFTNAAGGTIRINRGSADSQLMNQSGRTFTNLGQITLGDAAGANFGITNTGFFMHAGGSLSVTQAFNSAVNNAGSFTSAAPMSLSSIYSLNEGRGIFNVGTFTNNPGNLITIDFCSRGIQNQGGSITNAGIITMGASISVTTAIQNTSGTFLNAACSSVINLMSNSPIVTSGGSFSNAGSIIERATGTSTISTNTGFVRNLNSGTFTITNNTGILTTSAGKFWTGCTSTDWNTPGNWSEASVPVATDDVVISVTAINQPIISTTAVAKSVVVNSGASLSVTGAGSLSIDGALTHAITNSGTLTNGGSLYLGSVSALGDAGILNNPNALLSNVTGGYIQIDRTGGRGIANDGAIVNAATITIGSVAAVVNNGVFVTATGSFTNTTGGNLIINQSSGGLVNSGTFVNSASVTIGNLAFAAQDGIRNGAAFMNNATGEIRVDRAFGNGIWHSGGDLLNAGKIIIGAISGSSSGMLVRAPLTNSGEIR